jgi:hypothetical protein
VRAGRRSRRKTRMEDGRWRMELGIMGGFSFA